MLAKTLKEIEQAVSEFTFIRIHQSHLINVHFVKEINKLSNQIILKSDVVLPISRRKKAIVLNALNLILGNTIG